MKFQIQFTRLDSIVKLIMSVLTNSGLTEDLIQEMLRAVQLIRHKWGDPNDSTATTLLRLLEEKEAVVYCYMTESYSES